MAIPVNSGGPARVNSISSGTAGKLLLVVFLLFAAVVLVLAGRANPGLNPMHQLLAVETGAMTALPGQVFQGYGPLQILQAFLRFCLVFLLGDSLLRALLPVVCARFPIYVRICAGYFPGYCGVVALIRCWSLLVPYGWIDPPVALSVVGLALLWGADFFSGPAVPRKMSGLFFALVALVACVCIALLQVYQGDYMWVGHNQYAYILPEWEAAGVLHLPRIAQHHDEILFAYWFRPGAYATHPFLSIWLNLAILKVSVAVFLFMAFRHMGLANVPAAISTGFLCLGTFSALFWNYYMVFDSGNPIFMVVHAGRIVGIPLLFMLLLLLRQPVPARRGLLALGLVTVGLTTTSLSNFATISAILSMYVVLDLAGRVRLAPRIERGLWILRWMLVASFLLVPFILYPAQRAEGIWFVARAGFVIVVLALNFLFVSIYSFKALFALFRSFTRDDRRRVVLLAVFLVCAAIAFAILGNVFANNPIAAKVMELLGAVFGPTEYFVFHWSERIAGVVEFGEFRDLANDQADYMQGTGHFLAYYGFVLAIIAFVVLVFPRLDGWRKSRRDSDESRESSGSAGREVYAVGVAILLGLFPAIFFVIDFFGYITDNWVKTRLLEIPMYCVLFFVLLAFFTRANQQAARVVSAVLLVFTIGPILGTSRLHQMAVNYRWVTNQGDRMIVEDFLAAYRARDAVGLESTLAAEARLDDPWIGTVRGRDGIVTRSRDFFAGRRYSFEVVRIHERGARFYGVEFIQAFDRFRSGDAARFRGVSLVVLRDGKIVSIRTTVAPARK